MELKKLLKEQKTALEKKDIKKLNEVNKQIFAIREKLRKEKTQAREREKDNRTAKKIASICER
jgi:acyl-[acyl carrier protein]--UDP-N-acetylglucosamine O-acyltransferase